MSRLLPRLLDTSYLQRQVWRAGGSAAQVRALRLSGDVDHARLVAAIAEVVAAWEVLRVGFRADGEVPVMVPVDDGPAVRRTTVTGETARRDVRCVELLHEDRDDIGARNGPLVRFHVLEVGDDETVLGLAAHPLVLDVHAVYLVLGAVMLEYYGRFRADRYPPFAEFALLDPVPGVAARSSRSRWWSDRLSRWHPVAPSDEPRVETIALVLGDDRWRWLGGLGASGGNAGSLAVIALIAWWLRTRADHPGAPVFGSTLDLRDYLGLGPVVGPLTDRVVFEINLDGLPGLSVRDLLLRSHAGLLDSVVHYLPYGELAALGADRVWDVGMNYCRLPPSSSYTRGEADLASRGLSVELFGESTLVRSTGPIQGRMDLHFAESAAGMTLIVNFAATTALRHTVHDLVRGLDETIDKVLTDPGTVIGDL